MATLPSNLHEFLDTADSHGRIAKTLYRTLIRNRLAVRALFGVKVKRLSPGGAYFDATTIVLRREIRRQLRKYLYPRLLEIGTGPYALLSGSLCRNVRQRIVACDYDEAVTTSAAQHVEDNALNVAVVRSDLFSAIPVNEYDLIFWRLPRLDDPAPVLNRMLGSVSNYMASQARLVIGFNSNWIAEASVLDAISRVRDLQVVRSRRFWWNHREILTIQLSQNMQHAREHKPHL